MRNSAMTTPWKQLVKLAARILVATLLLIWVFSQVDFSRFWLAATASRWRYLIGVWVITAAVFWINSAKLRFILQKQGCDVTMNTLFGASAVTLLYSMAIPGILSTGVKWYILKKDTGKGSTVLSGMMYNQLSTLVVIMLLGLIALIATNPTAFLADGKNRWLLRGLAGLLAATVLVCLLALNRWTGARMIQIVALLLRPFPERIRGKGRQLLHEIAGFQTVGMRFHLMAALFTVAGMGGGGVALYVFAAKAANISVPVGVLVWLWATVYLLGRLPISIANLGVREVTLAGCLSLYAVETSAALLMSMILFSAILFMAVIGASYQVWWALHGQKPTSATG